MEKKKGLSEEQTPLATVGAVFRSHPAAVSETRAAWVSAIALFFAEPQVKVAAACRAGGVGAGAGGVWAWATEMAIARATTEATEVRMRFLYCWRKLFRTRNRSTAMG